MPNDEWGDFQTPRELADAAVATLGSGWTRVLEPTCGVGGFLAATAGGDIERIGIEVQTAYADEAQVSGATIINASVFDMDLATDIAWRTDGPLLVIGNPPWVTSSQLGVLGSSNLPQKSNLRNLPGFAAMTGASNFDISEYIILKLLVELAAEQPTVAMLCKTQVARNVIEFAHRSDLAVDKASIRAFDAKKWFGAAVDACLFTFRAGVGQNLEVPVFASLAATEPTATLGFVGERMVADIGAHRRAAFADGTCPFEWRQGVKHDAAAVMELNRAAGGGSATRDGNPVAVEDAWLFPLLKCTDVFHGRRPSRDVIVTQRALGDDTRAIETAAPRLWAYLASHRTQLDGRKSSIYRNRPPFSMFGIGDYTFAPWKVAVSGLHKHVRFRVVGPENGKPVVFDDTCYLLPFEHGSDAALTAALCASQVASDLLAALTFLDSKRPVTKKLLARIDLRAILRAVDEAELLRSASEMLSGPVSSTDLEAFRLRLGEDVRDDSPMQLTLC